MPVTVSYPGVYLEEIPSGVRSITGVATAVAAFVGRTLRGPENEATRLYSWAEFERVFGGLWRDSTVGYAVYHYFANGGSDAVIVRVSNGAATAAGASSTGGVQLRAIAAGAGGNALTLTVSNADVDLGTFDLEVVLGATTETYTGVSLDSGDPQYIGTVLAASALVTFVSAATSSPSDGVTTLAGGVSVVAASVSLDDGGGGSFVLEAAASGVAGNALSATVTVPGTGTANFDLAITDGVSTETFSFDPTSGDTFATFQAAINGGTLATAAAPPTADLVAVAAEPFTGGVDAVAASTTFLTASTAYTAYSGGTWGNNLRATVDYNTRDTSDTTLFNLTVQELDPDTLAAVATETFRNLSTDPNDTRYAEAVVNDESQLIRLDLGGAGGARPPVGTTTLSGGTDGSAVTGAGVIAGLSALETAEIFTILCTPPPSPDVAFDETGLAAVAAVAVDLCERRNAIWLVDAPPGWTSASGATSGIASLGISERHAAIYFPWLRVPDPLRENRLGSFAPCGVVAGIYARTDSQRGVWKAPAGLEATARGVRELLVKLTDSEQGALNQVGLNCLRTFPNIGTVVWGSRTLRGADVFSDDYKYVPVRRLANYLRESLYRGTQWAVFEPNDEPLWSQLRLTIGSFMQTLFRQGAFAGRSPREAYFVKCDRETTTPTDVNLGRVNILVGFAPLKPAEFVIIQLQQMAGQGG